MTMILLCWALGYAGFLSLAAAMPRHARQLNRTDVPVRIRALGIALLSVAAIFPFLIWNPARAVPIVIGMGSLAGIAVALTLSFAPRRALPIAS